MGREGRGGGADAAGFTHGDVMTGGSCLTFQLPTPSRQQLHPRARRELGPGQCGGLGTASQAPPVWVIPAWDGAAGRLNGAEQGGRQHPSRCLLTLHSCSAALRFSKPLGIQLAWSAWGHVPGMGLWQGPQVLLFVPCFSCCQVLLAEGTFLRGCGKFEASVHSLPAVGPLPARSHPGRLSQQLRKGHLKQFVLEWGQEDAPG